MGGDLAGVRLWVNELEAVHGRFVHRFNREEPPQSALAYMRGLIAPLERKNGWTLAEEAGHAGPDRIQRLLNRIEWDADEVLDDVRDYVVEHLGDPDAVLIVDDTGFLKKGIRSAGVQRQYSGTAGRTENCQVGVFLAYATGRGRTLVDRRLYLPTSWTDDRERRPPADQQGRRGLPLGRPGRGRRLPVPPGVRPVAPRPAAGTARTSCSSPWTRQHSVARALSPRPWTPRRAR